jgi:hypothetical protein
MKIRITKLSGIEPMRAASPVQSGITGDSQGDGIDLQGNEED